VTTPRSAERRSSKRTRARFPVRVWYGGQQAHGNTLDVSANGLFVETAAMLAIGTRVHFEIQHPDGSFHGEAIVVRQKRVPPNLRTIARPGVGLKLVPLTSLLRMGSDATHSTTLFELGVDLTDAAVLQETHARELRSGVLFVSCAAPPPVGAAVHVRVKLPAPYDAVTWRGRVVQKSAEPSGVAVELIDRAQVDALVREILGSYRT
jgi:Tfp pilus assembly protein PilZ